MASREQTHNCKEIFALLSDYLNLELPPDVVRLIESLAG